MSEASSAAAALGNSTLVRAGAADVSRIRRRSTRRRLARAIVFVYGMAALFTWLVATQRLHLPHLPQNADIWGPGAILVVLFAIVLLVPMLSTGRSPHVMIRPEHLETGLSDVQGLAPQVDEVTRSRHVSLG